MAHTAFRDVAIAATSVWVTFAAGATSAAPSDQGAAARAEHTRIVEHWTHARMAAAIPRDMVIDERGYGYLRKPDGSLEPYGHNVAAASKPASPQPLARPGGDATPPSISGLDPATGATVGASYAFKATVTDASGLRSVTFRVGPQGGQQQSFNAAGGANNVFSVQLSGLTNGTWTWSVVAKDTANNSSTSSTQTFTVDTSGGGGGGSGNVVTNAEWTGGGVVQNAVGRLYFEMPSNSRRTRWAGYVCSGTVVADATSGRSIVQTASHCVYDDSYKAFARNVLFIPNQSGTTGAATDLNCTNDPFGCWTAAFGVVDVNWTTRTFPDNVAWDYAYYVFNDAGAHTQGLANASDQLDGAVAPISVQFTVPRFNVANSTADYTNALGYSYSEDPNFMYCAEDMTQLDGANWWLGSCGLSGGSSGGSWIQPLTNGSGPLISVNSWGYTNQPGMAGPKLSGTSASCIFTRAKSGTVTATADGDKGVAVNNCP
jgi:Bacterial Ig-like domain